MQTHSQNKYPCKVKKCGSTFSVSQFLKVHMRLGHREKPYSTSKNMQIQIGEKPYFCESYRVIFSESGTSNLHAC